MELVALMGDTGTGKSTRALEVAEREGADYIIDDGLLIRTADRKIISGVVAKVCSNGALHNASLAVFKDEKESEKTKLAIELHKPKKILILCISKRMLNKITAALGLQECEKIIGIEEIQTPKEIEIANSKRGNKDNSSHTLIPNPESVIAALDEFARCNGTDASDYRRYISISHAGEVSVTRNFKEF